MVGREELDRQHIAQVPNFLDILLIDSRVLFYGLLEAMQAWPGLRLD